MDTEEKDRYPEDHLFPVPLVPVWTSPHDRLKVDTKFHPCFHEEACVLVGPRDTTEPADADGETTLTIPCKDGACTIACNEALGYSNV